MEKSKNKFTLKIVLSYLLLLLLAGVATYYIYSEIGTYIAKEGTEKGDSKLLKTSSLITQLYEAESLSKLALQSKEKKDFDAYVVKIDSTYDDIQQLKNLTTNTYQKQLLDSLQKLLKRKVANNRVLRRLKTRDQTNAAIDKAIGKFDELEESLGVITPEGIAPNINELSPKAQEVIRDVAKYLNDNVPKESEEKKALRADSVLQASRALLKEVQKENTINETSLALREVDINKTDIELSQQLKNILSSFEQEILMNTIKENLKKESALKRSIRLAIITTILGIVVVGIFIFILNRDFWKASLYRQNLEKEKKYSEALLKSREQLIGTVSHDLRTPLNAITGYTNLLEDSNITLSQGQHLAQIKSATNYVNNLVNDLLDFNQLEAGKMAIEKIPFSLYSLLEETSKDFITTKENEDVITDISIEDSLKTPIINDPLRIRQIVSNLLGNAYKFTSKGKIKLEARLMNKKENVVQIIVSDTGIGIALERQKHIFDEFTQITDQDLKRYGGYGLGLTISKKLAELLGGTISLESEMGKGSTFILEIPVIFSHEKVVPEQGKQFSILDKNLGILIIDDDTSFLKMLGEMMKTENIKTHLYSDFNQIQKRENLFYKIVLTDIEMPVATGFDVIKNLQNGEFSHYKGQPIIAMTGRRDLNSEFFMEKGFSKVIKKPFTKNAILQIISTVLKGQTYQVNIPKKILDLEKGTQAIYRLENVKMFLGNDDQAIFELLYTFKKDTIANQKELKSSIMAANWNQVSKTAHRMLPMFRQLEITSCIPFLEKFENLSDMTQGLENIKEQFKSLEIELDKLIAELDLALS